MDLDLREVGDDPRHVLLRDPAGHADADRHADLVEDDVPEPDGGPRDEHLPGVVEQQQDARGEPTASAMIRSTSPSRSSRRRLTRPAAEIASRLRMREAAVCRSSRWRTNSRLARTSSSLSSSTFSTRCSCSPTAGSATSRIASPAARSQTRRSVAISAPPVAKAKVAPDHSGPAAASRRANASRWAVWTSASKAVPASRAPASRSSAGLASSTVPSGASAAANIVALCQV